MVEDIMVEMEEEEMVVVVEQLDEHVIALQCF